MDSGGTWNGSAEVTNTTGDSLALTIQNSGVDTAFDLQPIDVEVPTGFRLPHSPFTVPVREAPLDPLCPAMPGLSATQAGGAGAPITIAVPPNSDIPPSCSYTLTLGLTTVDTSPFVAAGNYPIEFTTGYNDVDNDATSRRNETATQRIEVRRGSVALLKSAVTPSAGDGDTVEFTISVLGAGQGGIFDVIVTDTLSPDLTGLSIVPPASPPGHGGPGTNRYTLDYIAPGERVDITVRAVVAVSPSASSCPDLRNDASVVERTGDTGSGFDSVPYDLKNPYLSYGAPVIDVPFGATGTRVTVPVRNTGDGVAKNVSLTIAQFSAYSVVIDGTASPNWSYSGAGVFVHAGTLAPGASDDLVFNISTASCPPPAPVELNWVPNYQNACGTKFYPPLQFSRASVSNIPTLNIDKSVSSRGLNIGQSGSYLLSLSGINVAALPDDGVADNRDFVVSDTLPSGVTGAVINTIPATTEVLVNGAPYSAGAVIPDNAVITWRGDRADLLPSPSLRIDFTAGSVNVCPVGQAVSNTATVSYPGCGISDTSDNAGASFILNQNPAGGPSLNLSVGGDGAFEAGARDTDAIAADEPREGEHIPFTARYTFPDTSTGTWNGTAFTADLRSSAAAGRPLVLTNGRRDVHVRVTRLADGAVMCDADLNPSAGDFTGGDGNAPMVIPDLGALSVCSLPANTAGHELVITYAATSPEGDLDVSGDPANDDNIGSYIENTTLTVSNGPLGCLGTSDYVQGASVDIVRAAAGLDVNINNGEPVAVCSVVPVTVALNGPAAGTRGENLQLKFSDANFEFVDAAGNPGDPATDISYSGALSSLGLNASRAGSDILLQSAPVTATFTGNGSATFNVRLRDNTVPQSLTAQVDFDSHHTAPDGAPSDHDRDYSGSATGNARHVLQGQLEMEFLPPNIILRDRVNYVFRAQITNVGTGDAVNAKYRISFPAGFTPVNGGATSPLPAAVSNGGQTFEWGLGDLAPGASVNLDIEANIDQTTCFQGPGENIVSENEWGCGSPIVNTEINPQIVLPPAQLELIHDPNTSFCELCNEGEVRLLVTNSGGVLLTNVDVTEDLRSSGLTYVAGTTTYSVDGAAAVAGGDPVVAGAAGERLTWGMTQIPELANLYSAFSAGPLKPQSVEIRFKVRRNTAAGFSEEGLAAADLHIQASAGYGLFCGPPPQRATSDLFELPVHQPVPRVVKQGRNVDAAQSETAYGDTVYGGTNDDVIWRVTVQNNGAFSRADLQDLIVSDAIGGNFDINWVCNSEANATLAANGSSPGAPYCISAGGGTVTTVNGFAVDDPFGNPGNDEPGAFVDVVRGGSGHIYFVGRIRNTCTNHVNNAGIEWGCEADGPPDGGISTPIASGGATPPFGNSDSALLSTAVDPAGLTVTQRTTGANPGQPLGTRGVITLTLTNRTGGSVRNIRLRDVLPSGYALDTTLLTAHVAPAFADYEGMIDTVTLGNPQSNPEDNTQPRLVLTSSTGTAPQDNLLRHGDVLTVRLGIVRVTGFDLSADPTVRTENASDGSDPAIASPVTNQVYVDFENTCGTSYTTTSYPLIDNAIVVAPEDLDIDINPGDPNLIYILSDPVASLTMDVVLRNNGGHDATDYFALVTVGSGLNVLSLPAACVPATNPPPRAVWIPALPASATVYRCSTRDPLPPGQGDQFRFEVEKRGSGADLTFRADVVGEITLADGTPLTFPAPVTGPISNSANNYSLDSIRARLIGFNLTNVLQGDCSEDNPAPVANDRVEIGEDCTHHIEAGWFGFATPGFGSIGVENIVITDTVASGQGYIAQDTSGSSAGITGITTSPAALNTLDQGAISWSVNPLATDETFVAEVRTRTLNDPRDAPGVPNAHAAVGATHVDARFDVNFGGTIFTFDPATPGYPAQAGREVDLTVTEPRLMIDKEVCDETLYGVGPTCSNFVPLVDDGDTNDQYVYRVTIANEASSGGVERAPAYDVTLTDSFDASDLLVAAAFDSDGLDNDGDGLVDEGGEASINDNNPNNGVAGVLTISHLGSAALQRINPGESVTLYYRVDPADNAAPGQRLVNSVVAQYDSLEGAFGHQMAPQRPVSDVGGARAYATAAAQATIEITALVAPPDSKAILRLSHDALGGAAPFVGPQDVVVGEELEYQLRVLIPIANLNDFVIRDELPAGLRCIEAPVVDLGAGPFAGVFSPGGVITPTCAGNLVEWQFGNQQLTSGPTFDFVVRFIARVENGAATNEGAVIRNGGTGAGSSSATVNYRDAGGNPVTIALGPADLTVREPRVSLALSYDTTRVDADDVVTVTATATNTGSAAAYHLRVLEDLSATPKLRYLGNVSGLDPPDAVDTATLGANRPVFSWGPASPAMPIAPGASVSFTFQLQVGSDVQPLERLANTVQAQWTSLPDRNTALNSSAQIDADGTVGGMRIGALPPGGDAVNDYETSIAAAALTVPAVAVVKSDLDTTVVPAIGARKSFRVDIDLPEGITAGLKLDDVLASAGVSYVLENNASYDIAYTFRDIQSINGQPPGEAGFMATPADGVRGVATWDIGTVETRTEDDHAGGAVDPLIRIDYRARVDNDLSIHAGVNLQNSAQLEFLDGGNASPVTATSTPPAVTVVEPAITLASAFRNVTSGKLPDELPDGGDVIEYRLTIANTGDATAFDVNVADTLPTGVHVDGGFTATASIGGVAVPGFVATPTELTGGKLVWGRANGDETLDIPSGQSLELVFRVVVDATVEPNLALDDAVLVDWTSLDGGDSAERTGAGCPQTVAPDTYCVGPVSAALRVIDANSVGKTVIADDYADPADATVRVGDTVTYRLEVNLQEGRTRAIDLRDTLPAGMVLDAVLSINGDDGADGFFTPPASGPGSNFAYAAIDKSAALPQPGQGGVLQWNLGTVTNDPSGDSSSDTLVIEYRARVAADSGLAHLVSTTLTNTVALSYLDANDTTPAGAPRLGDAAAITVLQPLIDGITITDRSGRASGVQVNPASDVMNYRLTVCNAAGGAPAYALVIEDLLPTQHDEGSIAGPINGALAPDVYIDGALASEGTGNDYVFIPPATRGGTMRFSFNTPLAPSACVDIDFDIAFHNDFGIGQGWDNRVVVNEYHSLPGPAGQQYPPVGPAAFNMHNIAPIFPPAKTLQSPGNGEATIGQEVVYRIVVPGQAMSGALYDVTVTDTLDPSLVLVAAADVSGNGLTVTDRSTVPGQVTLGVDRIPAGQQAVIELRARVANVAAAAAGTSFNNTADYSFASVVGGPQIAGGGDTTVMPLHLVEPAVTVVKAVSNLTNPGGDTDAGDVLHYTLTLSAAGGGAGDDYATAYDVEITDRLDPGLAYLGNIAVSGAGNTIGAPRVVGDGVSAAQQLDWSLANGNADVNLPEGAVVTVSYDVVVLDSARAQQVLANTAVVRWSSLDGSSPYERTGSGVPAENDYTSAPASTSVTTADSNALTKRRIEDSWGGADPEVRVGDIVEYELRLTLQEGTTTDVVVSDTLPQGLAFEGIARINGDAAAPFEEVAPFSHAAVLASNAIVSGDPRSGPTTVTWSLGTIVNRGDNLTNNDFVIVYRARVLDQVHPQAGSIALQNNASFGYTTAAGAALPRTSDSVITLLQPSLTVTKSAAPDGGDTVLEAGELVTYTVDITNGGTAPAYDAVLEDIVPLGMRGGAATITPVSMTLVGAGTVLPAIAPSYDAATGTATWNLDVPAADRYTIPAGETLRIVYQVQADPGLAAGMTLSNQAQVRVYYSFDNDAVPRLGDVTGVRQAYGPSNVATATLTTPAPNPLSKQNPALSGAGIGEPITYRITVPAVPQATALHDVRIVDDLTLSAAALEFVSVAKVAGSQAWNPVNIGTDTQPVIADSGAGIEIPAGEQAVIDITVRLRDTAKNSAGLGFTNTASYTFDQIDGNEVTRTSGGADTTPELRVVEPELIVRKSGPATMRYGLPGTFTIDVENLQPGGLQDTGPAWNLTISDRLPSAATPMNRGGMCAVPPTNIRAQIFLADGVTPVGAPLIEGTDFVTAFRGAPDCLLSITMQTPGGRIEAGQHLIVSYEATLDIDSLNGAMLTNVAGANEWFSADASAAGVARVYNATLSDGSPGVDDHEDEHTVLVEAPVLDIEQTVRNLTSGQYPGTNAEPGDTLHYTISVHNTGPVALADFSLTDELDRLDSAALFVPGSLSVTALPPGADAGASLPTGGARGTGLLDVRNLSLDAVGGANDTVVIEYEAQLVPVIDGGTVVANQTLVAAPGFSPLPSDDPNQPGSSDPTRTVIGAMPIFQVLKSSQDMSGDPQVLRAGDTIAYTITVKNVGLENATHVVLRDQVPANTRYVSDSTQLNGLPVTDPAPGTSPLQDGIEINAPEDPTPGYLRADPAAAADNVATVTFRVTVDGNVVNGTVISNQAFVTAQGAGSGPRSDTPSDNPATEVVGDPTEDVVGSVPVLDAKKSVAVVVDGGVPGQADPGDTLRYTITIGNTGTIAATGVVFSDAVPAGTTYVADSVVLNGIPYGRPDGGASPLTAGIDVSSADMTPPLPAAGKGTVGPGQTATITFEVTIDPAVAVGAVISNQGRVSSAELPDEPTDADGNDENGDQPTQITVGADQQLHITNEVFVVGGGVAQAGGRLEYVVTVGNIGSVPVTDIVIGDNLNAPVAAQISYVADSGRLNGSPNGVAFSEPVLSADYASPYGSLDPGESITLRFLVDINATLAAGTNIDNTVSVSWNAGLESASDSVSIDVGGAPGVANLHGSAWHDADFDNVRDDDERRLGAWDVDIYLNGRLLDTVVTDADGRYAILGLPPSLGGNEYELRFRAPGAGANSASLGQTDSPFTDGPQHISGISVVAGGNTLGLNLPIDPDGVVYDAVVRTPVPGATLTLVNAASGQPVSAACFEDPTQQNQITLADGYYKFDVNFTQPDCPTGAEYLVQIKAPGSGYFDGPSVIMPPSTPARAFDVPSCPGSTDDGIPSTAAYCEISTSEFAPPASVALRSTGTRYFLRFRLDATSHPGSGQVFNNHIPLDPYLDEAIAISKTSALLNVTRGQLVPYTITLSNTLAAPLQDLDVVDRFPAGFKYVPGSARIDGVAAEPRIDDRQLSWPDLSLNTSASRSIKLLLIVGSGVGEGEYVNRAQAINSLTGGPASGEASATVRVVPDPTFDCTDIIGKVFDDRNLDGRQDEGEDGISGVRIATARGLLVTSDRYGRFHIACAAVPNADRGSNFILKLDERTLPAGYRMTTENPRVQRVTRGKLLKYNFGATIHRVVRLDMADAVFARQSTEMRPQWRPRLDLLLDTLGKAPSVLRLSYLAENEEPALVNARVAAVKAEILSRWSRRGSGRALTIETEIFWRRGGPPDREVSPQ